MKDLPLELVFYQCQGTSLENIEALVGTVFEFGFEFEQNVGERMRKVQRREQIEGLVNGHCRILQTDSKTDLPTKWRVAFPAHPKNMEDLIASLEFYQLDSRTNRLQIYALIDFEFADQSSYVEPYAQLLCQLARHLYLLAKPGLGWIDRADKNTSGEKDVRKQRLSTISWVNFFGPEYVQRYSKDFFLELPGSKTELLSDGGVFHQLSADFVAGSQKESKVIRQQVTDYCAVHDVKVGCYAPYYLPNVAAVATSGAEVMSDVDVKEYLAQILGTTFVLDDGTRIKPIYIIWTDLTSSQRQMVIQSIRQVAVEEIERTGGSGRVRFEFNEIPDELHQMLLSLVGCADERLEWVRVDMD